MNSKHAITERLARLQSWRYGLETQLARISEALREAGFLASDGQHQLDELQNRVHRERVTIAFVAENARGKSELINGLFFSDLGRRLLPSGLGRNTGCVTELRFDRDKPTSIRLLSTATRETPLRFSDLYADPAQWRTIDFKADDEDSVSRALGALSETRRVALHEAVAWGLHGRGVGVETGPNGASFVDVPLWRYAIVNFPHPLLDAGLVVIDTPGLAAFSAEPELARERMPKADALLLVLDVSEGVTKPDLAIWKEHLGGGRNLRERETDEIGQARMVVLNKIDELTLETRQDTNDAAREMLRELDKRVKDAADLLRIDPIRVIPVSAKLGLLGRFANDTDKILRSRLYQLERSLAANLPSGRQDSLTAEITATLSSLLDSAQAQLDQQRFDVVKGLSELGVIRAKNEKMLAALELQTDSVHKRLDATFRELRRIKAVHTKLTVELADIVDIAVASNDIARTKLEIKSSIMPSTALESCHHYFSRTEERLDAFEAKVDEIRALFGSIGNKIRSDFELGGVYQHDAHPFATQRFRAELAKAREKAETEFGKASNLFIRRGSALADQFEEVIASRVLRIFQIASHETATWMRGLYTALEKPLEGLRLREGQRTTNMERIRAADLDLAERISDLQIQIDLIRHKHLILGRARQGLDRFLGSDRRTADDTAMN